MFDRCRPGVNTASAAQGLLQFFIEKGLLAVDDVSLLRHMDTEQEYLRHLVASGTLAGGEPRGGEYRGVKALMLAVLDNALQHYCGPMGRTRTEAEEWLAARNARSPFSFNTVCEVLGLEPDAARRAIRGLRAQMPPKMHKPRMRPNSRRRA